MAPKIKLLLIPIVILILLRPEIRAASNEQGSSNETYLPIITASLTGWIGPHSGTVVSIAYDPANPQIVYAGSYGSGVFKSLDGGRSWSPASQGLSNPFIYSLAVDPQHPSTLYAGTYRGQVYKSTNGGSSWKWSGNGMQADAIVYSLAVDPFDTNNLYATTRGDSNGGNPPWNGVVYRSWDAGYSWVPSLFNVGGVDQEDWAYSVAVNSNAHNQVYAATHEHGPYRSDNFGSTWQAVDDGISDLSARAIIINPQPEYAAMLYLGVWHSDSVYKSVNNGGAWFLANGGKPNVKVYSMAMDRFSTETIYLASFSNGILKTTDGAEYWQYAGLLSNDIYSIVIDPIHTNNLLAGTSSDGIYRSADSASNWQHSNTGLDNARVTADVHIPNHPNTIFASVYGSGVYETNDGGRSWQDFNTGLIDKWVEDLVLDPGSTDRLYALTDTAGLFSRDLDSNTGWVKAGSGLPLTTQHPPAFPPNHPFATAETQEYDVTRPQTTTQTLETTIGLLTMIYAPTNPRIAYMGTNGHGVQRSSDGGASWQAAGLAGDAVYSIAVDSNDPNLLFAATGSPGSMKLSTDGGKTWNSANLPQYFYALAASPSEPKTVYAGTGGGIYLYEKNAFRLLGLSSLTVTAVAIDPYRPNVVYAGTTSGAYYSTDNGHHWIPVSSQLNGITIQSMNFDQGISTMVFFDTTTHGIFLASMELENMNH